MSEPSEELPETDRLLVDRIAKVFVERLLALARDPEEWQERHSGWRAGDRAIAQIVRPLLEKL